MGIAEITTYIKRPLRKKKTRSCVFSQAAKKGKQKQAVSSLRKVFEGEK